MSTSVGVSVLMRVAAEVKQSKERQFTSAHGEMMASLPLEDLQVVQAASELIVRGVIVKVIATPSQRSFYRVESQSKFKRRDREADVSIDTGTHALDDSMSSSAKYYSCFSHYCTCAVFHETTVTTHPTAMCKHMVARLLVDATGDCKTMQVDDAHFAQMLGTH
ncbi:hypothetical protein PsorP6_003198 [Peronosclerospora sorghi]|uniref:Uncharacterized protein n=1 Tax=Peronosclerospora sorghi TaxID=230839 RepID=A0ACC0VML0_9STRA|nr:hypothetical protein PsorP6_003198 [Peronosclerospora sorghi]